MLLIMRINIRLLFVFIVISISFLLLTFFTKCQLQQSIRRITPKFDLLKNSDQVYHSDKELTERSGYEELDCLINGEYSISCRKEGEEVYVPFSFLHKYYEVYGKLASYDGLQRFEWSHSYSKVYQPKTKYDPRGVFMYFENYNVEVRERVKCLSAIEGVPISTQWESQGYFYPTQIAQFGLSHYSKNLTEPEPRRKVLEDADRDLAEWKCLANSTFNRLTIANCMNQVFAFHTAGSLGSKVSLPLDHVLDLTLQVDLNLSPNASLTVSLLNRETDQVFHLHYISSELHISAQREHTYHGVGKRGDWVRITRDLVVDIVKGSLFQNRQKKKLSRSKMMVIEIALHGSGQLDNLTLSSSEHLSNFYDAAEWFVNHQDPNTGGWTNPVKRRLAAGMAELQSGWTSSMGLGHGISVLARAYHHSGGNMKYLHSALEALRPFRLPSKDGGVLTSFLDKYPWYEEYPTTPPSFVLNGFIYSLLGLYDLKTIAPAKYAKEASVLYEQGMKSLKNMLPLFDMGSTTSYDLRHFTLRVAPNIARWDYHATHVNQVLILTTIDDDPLLISIGHRWLEYMNGKKAAHN